MIVASGEGKLEGGGGGEFCAHLSHKVNQLRCTRHILGMETSRPTTMCSSRHYGNDEKGMERKSKVE